MGGRHRAQQNQRRRSRVFAPQRVDVFERHQRARGSAGGVCGILGVFWRGIVTTELVGIEKAPLLRAGAFFMAAGDGFGRCGDIDGAGTKKMVIFVIFFWFWGDRMVGW